MTMAVQNAVRDIEESMADLLDLYAEEGMQCPDAMAERLGREVTAVFRSQDMLSDDCSIAVNYSRPHDAYVLSLVGV